MPTTQFNPATHGFHFVNDFVVSANRIGPLPDIKFTGLCGGMSYAALDFYYADRATPKDDFSPFVGSPLEAYIFERQQQSLLKSPANIARWAELTVNPFGARNNEFYGWAVGERFAELRARIDDGHPVPLGLKGGDGFGDHQVAAIGYEMGRYRGDKGAHQEDIRIFIYDPNYPGVTTELRTDERNRKIVHTNGGGRWQGYFVDPEYRVVTPPDLRPPTTYPRDGLVHEVLVEIRTGGDDLRGQNDNVHAEVVRKDGAVQIVPNINGLQRWVDNSPQAVTIVLDRAVRREQLESIRLRTTFGGGWNGDNWNVDKLRIRVREDNQLVQVYERAGAPLVRFDGNNTPFVARLSPGRFTAAQRRLRLFALDQSGSVVARYQERPNGGWNAEGWQSLGGKGLRSLAACDGDDGRVGLFAIGGDGSVYSRWQRELNGGWNEEGWGSLGGKDVRQIAVALNASDRLALFALGGDGVVYGRSQLAGGGWNPEGWTSLGGTQFQQVTVSAGAGDRLELFAIDRQGAVHRRWQRSGGSWNERGWESLGGRGLRRVAVAANADGRISLFALGSDGVVYGRWQTERNGGWNQEGWSSLAGTQVEQIVAGSHADGRLALFALGGDGAVYHRWQRTANGGWNREQWEPLGGDGLAAVAVETNADGRLALFALGRDGAVYNRWQREQSGGWNEEKWGSMQGTSLRSLIVAGRRQG